MIKEKNKIIAIVILILITLIALTASSYALLTKSYKSKALSVSVGTLKVDFKEGNVININNTKPMSDSDGMNTTPYTFTITNSGTIKSYYTISTEENTTNTLNTNYLNMRITGSDGYDSGVKKVSELGTGTFKIVDEKQLETSKSVTYKLYLWITNNAGNDIQNKTYQSKIIVNSTSNKTN